MANKKLDLTGQRFGRWTVLYPAEPRISSSGRVKNYMHCRCDCGTERDVYVSSLTTGESLSCGCYFLDRMTNDLTGQTFGRLTVVRQGEGKISSGGNKRTTWICTCSCDPTKEIEINGNDLVTGKTKSCGCLHHEACVRNGKQKHITNDYDLSGDYGIGYTTDGRSFYFDKEDFDLIKDFGWYFNNKGYVKARTKDNKSIALHRLVMNVQDNRVIDHIDHNVVNNCKYNLRIVTRQQNAMNSKISKNNTSGFKGVQFDKNRNKWFALIRVNNKQIHLGYYDNINDAAQARKEAEDKYFGEYSYENSMKLAAQNITKLKEKKNAQSQVSGYG